MPGSTRPGASHNPACSGVACAGLTALVVVFLSLTAVFIICLLLLCPLFLVPLATVLVPVPALILWRVTKSANSGVVAQGRPDLVQTPDTVLRFFASGFWPASSLVLLCELVLTVIFAVVLLGPQLKAALEELRAGAKPEELSFDTSTAGFKVLTVLMAYVVAALVEETAKLIIVRCSCCSSNPCCIQHSSQRNARVTLVLFVAGAAGFSTIENILYTWNTCSQGLGMLELLGIVRGFLDTPLHCLCAAFTAAKVARRDLRRSAGDRVGFIGWTLIPGVMLHGSLDLFFFLVPSSNVLQLASAGVGVLVCLISLVVWKRCYWRPLVAAEAAQLQLDRSMSASGVAAAGAAGAATYADHAASPSPAAVVLGVPTNAAAAAHAGRHGTDSVGIAMAQLHHDSTLPPTDADDFAHSDTAALVPRGSRV